MRPGKPHPQQARSNHHLENAECVNNPWMVCACFWNEVTSQLSAEINHACSDLSGWALLHGTSWMCLDSEAFILSSWAKIMVRHHNFCERAASPSLGWLLREAGEAFLNFQPKSSWKPLAHLWGYSQIMARFDTTCSKYPNLLYQLLANCSWTSMVIDPCFPSHQIHVQKFCSQACFSF